MEYLLKIWEWLKQRVEPNHVSVFIKLLMIWVISYLYLKLFTFIIRIFYSIYLIFFISSGSYLDSIATFLEQLS